MSREAPGCDAAGPREGRSPSNSKSVPESLGRLARQLYQERRIRDEIFGDEPLTEGAWDLLLDLYSATAERSAVATMSACVAAQIPTSTAQRLIKKLERRGMIRSLPAEDDRRVKHLVLTDGSEAKLTAFLTCILQERQALRMPGSA